MNLSRKSTGEKSSKVDSVKVLVADDFDLMLEIISKFISEQGSFDVVAVAHNGTEAVERAGSIEVDLVILDLNMPRMSGLEATKRIKDSQRPPRVIIVSLNDDEPFRRAALEAGADGFCSKLQLETQLLPLLRKLVPQGFSG